MDEVAKLKVRLLVHRHMLMTLLSARTDLETLAIATQAADNLEEDGGNPERAAIYRDELDRLLGAARTMRGD